MQVVLLRVGIDSGCGGMQGALLENNKFEYIPIPDTFQKEGIDKRTYGNTRGQYGRLLVEYFPKSRRKRMAKQSMHLDPEFKTFTYGDPTVLKGSLRKLKGGDLLIFYCGLSKWDASNGRSKRDHDLYMIGYFEVKAAGYGRDFSEKSRHRLFKKNFHVMHKRVFVTQKNRLVLVKGSKRSRLLKRAVKISSNGRDKKGKPLKVISREMRKNFGTFGGHLSIRRSGPKWVVPKYVEQAAQLVRAQR